MNKLFLITVRLCAVAVMLIAYAERANALGDWIGDCGGPGYFPATDDNNAYYSHTGCYNPEERFVFLEETTDFNDKVYKRGMPRDDVLSLNPYCIGKEGDPSGDLVCLNNDAIDDIDNFCGGYKTAKTGSMYKTDNWKWNGSCWENHPFPVYLEAEAGDHWLPLAYDVEILNGSGADDTISVGSTPYSDLYGYLGEYGYLKKRIVRAGTDNISGNQDPLDRNQFDLSFSRKNIYQGTLAAGVDESDLTSAEALSLENIGVKAKKMRCLKQYIEEWAHRGDCGEIVIVGAGPEVDASMCQWLTVYDTYENEALLTSLNKKEAKVCKRWNFDKSECLEDDVVELHQGLRSEQFDFENFNHTGYIPRGLEGTLSQTDICSVQIKAGTGSAFWEEDGLDFSKRGCPTVSGPDMWGLDNNTFDMKRCHISKGAAILDYDGWGALNGDFNRAFLLSADIDIKFGLQLAFGWGLATGAATGVPITALEPSGEVTDWADYSWTAASCDHILNSASTNDYWNQRPDYNFSSGCKTPDCEVDGYDVNGSDKLYSYNLNVIQFSTPAFWCDFEVPYYPFADGNNLRSALTNPTALAKEPTGRIELKAKKVERIRDGCGAFSQRGTWKEDTHNELGKWLLFDGGKPRTETRCEGWRGLHGRQYKDPKIVNWRLPRFTYEFMRAFIECTGPWRKAPKVCGSTNWVRVAYNCIPKTYGGCGCCWKLDDDTMREESEYDGSLSAGLVGGFGNSVDDDDRPGFWCRCPQQNWITTTCDETMCTCQQNENDGDAWDPAYCEEYGPFKRWLQCYYQARAKACPVLTRDVSLGVMPGNLMITPDD